MRRELPWIAMKLLMVQRGTLRGELPEGVPQQTERKKLAAPPKGAQKQKLRGVS